MIACQARMVQRCVLIGALMAFSALVGSRVGAAEAPVKPVELKVLDRLVGDWTTASTITVLDGKPESRQSTGTAQRRWALDGRILEESGKSADGEEVKVIFGYDVFKSAYRMWYFSSNGAAVDQAGPWDEAAQTFSMKSDLGNGVTQISTIHFTDKDHHEWTSKVTDAAGKVLFEGSGTLARKK